MRPHWPRGSEEPTAGSVARVRHPRPGCVFTRTSEPGGPGAARSRAGAGVSVSTDHGLLAGSRGGRSTQTMPPSPPPPGVPMGTTDTGPARPISEVSPVAFSRQEESAKPRVHQRVDSHPLLRRVGCGACSRRKKVFQGHEEAWPSIVPSQRLSTSSGLSPGL